LCFFGKLLSGHGATLTKLPCPKKVVFEENGNGKNFGIFSFFLGTWTGNGRLQNQNQREIDLSAALCC